MPWERAHQDDSNDTQLPMWVSSQLPFTWDFWDRVSFESSWWAYFHGSTKTHADWVCHSSRIRKFCLSFKILSNLASLRFENQSQFRNHPLKLWKRWKTIPFGGFTRTPARYRLSSFLQSPFRSSVFKASITNVKRRPIESSFDKFLEVLFKSWPKQNPMKMQNPIEGM